VRQHVRSCVDVWIYPRSVCTDDLGCTREQFDLPAHRTKGSVEPVSNTLGYAANGLAHLEAGVKGNQAVRVCLPEKTAVKTGDGVGFEEDGGAQWRCVFVEKWHGHMRVKLERMA